MFDQAQKLRELAALKDEPVKRARVLAVTSGKGGVGKTNLSVGLALTACAQGQRTVILDGDLGLANVDVILDVQSRYNLSHVLSGEASIEDALTSGPGGVQVLPGATGLTRMANLSTPEHQMLLRSLEGLEQCAELMIVDTGAGISRRVIEFCLASDEVLVVTTPEPTAIADAYAMIKVLRQAESAIRLNLIVNMATTPTEARQVADKIINVSRRHLNLEVNFAGYVLSDPRVPHAVRRRTPFSLAYPGTQAAAGVRDIARVLGLDSRAAVRGSGFFRRMSSLFRQRLGLQVGEGA
ncbi:MAG: MinD/ParA family protein [Planctomycetota bacterium]